MRRLNIILILAIFFVLLKPVWAGDGQKCLQGIEFLSGFGQGELIQRRDYIITPLLVGFDFNLKPLTERFGFNPAGLLQFQVEPFVTLTSRPETNFETGISFWVKLGMLPETSKVQPYLRVGTGMIYLTQHTLDQSTQFNFLVQGGTGMHYFFKNDTALTIEYRFRHLSNASIKEPNHGIDSHLFLVGAFYRI